jgi:hypothetical protein
VEFEWKVPLGCQIRKFWVIFWFLDLIIITTSAIRFVLRGNLLNKTQGLTYLSRNLYGRYSKDVKFQNCMHLFWFLDPEIAAKNGITFVLRWHLLNKTFISPFWVKICIGGTLRTQNFKILSTLLSFKYKIAEQKCNQIGSTVKYVEQNSSYKNLGEVKIRSLVPEISS